MNWFKVKCKVKCFCGFHDEVHTERFAEVICTRCPATWQGFVVYGSTMRYIDWRRVPDEHRGVT